MVPKETEELIKTMQHKGWRNAIYNSNNFNQHFSLQVQSSVYDEEGELDFSLMMWTIFEEHDDFETTKATTVSPKQKVDSLTF